MSSVSRSMKQPVRGASHRVDVNGGDDGARRTRVRTTNLVVDGTSVDVVVVGFTGGFSFRAIDRWILEGQRGRRGRGLSRIIAVGDAEPGVREQEQVEIQGVAREEVGERR